VLTAVAFAVVYLYYRRSHMLEAGMEVDATFTFMGLGYWLTFDGPLTPSPAEASKWMTPVSGPASSCDGAPLHAAQNRANERRASQQQPSQGQTQRSVGQGVELRHEQVRQAHLRELLEHAGQLRLVQLGNARLEGVAFLGEIEGLEHESIIGW